MSNKASAWAWEIAEAHELDIYQAMVLLRLAEHSNTEGFCWPGKDSLTRKCRCSARKVDTVILELQGMNLLRIEQRSSGGRSITNVYHLNLNQAPLIVASKGQNPAQCAGVHNVQGGTPRQKTPHTTTENPAQRAPEPSYNRKEPSVISSSADEAQKHPAVYESKKGKRLSGVVLELFEKFWTAFDYKSGKAEAADAWLETVQPRLKSGALSIEHLLAAARHEASERPGLEAKGQTPKMAQGWLSARRWDDFSPPQATPPPSKDLPWYCTWDGIQERGAQRGILTVMFPLQTDFTAELIRVMQAAGEEVPPALIKFYQQMLERAA